jgi:hypothetical protein
MKSSSRSSFSSLAECIQQKKRNGRQNEENEVEILYNPKKIEIQSQPEHVVPEDSPRFEVGDPHARDYFVENGYVVIKEVASSANIISSNLLFWNFLEKKTKMRRDDPSSWSNSNFREIGSSSTGIIGGGGFGQSEFMWSLRTLPSVTTSFNLLYGRDPSNQLITSFDGGVMFRPWQQEEHPDAITWCTQSGWFHVDQGRSLRGSQCIQGVLSLTDCNERTGGLCLIPKSHLYHDELVDSLPAHLDGNYVPVPASFHVLTHPQILPTCRAGEDS